MFTQQSLFDNNQFNQTSEVGRKVAPAGAFQVSDSHAEGSIGNEEGRHWKMAGQAVLFVVNLSKGLNTILGSLGLVTSSWGNHKAGWLIACLAAILILIVVFVRNRKLLRDIYEPRL
jgi:uncharacterized membrane protein